MFSCEHCNWHGKQEDLSHYSDYRGEYQGHPAYERIPCCPVCGHDVYIDENKKIPPEGGKSKCTSPV